MDPLLGIDVLQPDANLGRKADAEVALFRGPLPASIEQVEDAGEQRPRRGAAQQSDDEGGWVHGSPV